MKIKFIAKVLRWIVASFFISSIIAVIAYRWIPVYVTPLMLIRCVQSVANGESPKLYHHWIPLDEMSVYMPVAVMASEDQNFRHHHGFDMNAIVDAAKEKMEGKRRRGGSTISQQTAKNVFLWPSSTWIRKGFEAYFTVLIELFWSKERIMEVYLNSIEMGDGIYGVAAVAAQNFDCEANQLTRSDCALIAATLPNPRRFSSKHPGPFMRSRQRWIQSQMRNIDVMHMD